MLNFHCNKKGKKNLKELCDNLDSNPGSMGSKSTEVSTMLWRPMDLADKNN